MRVYNDVHLYKQCNGIEWMVSHEKVSKCVKSNVHYKAERTRKLLPICATGHRNATGIMIFVSAFLFLRHLFVCIHSSFEMIAKLKA